MAIDRFQNENILIDSKSPVDMVDTYSQLDLSRLTTALLPSNNAIDFPIFQNQESILDNAFVETHIYSSDNLINSLPPYELKYTTADTNSDYDYDILNVPEYDIRQSNLTRGYYTIIYNYVKPITGDLQIDRVSADGTEVEVSAKSGNIFNLWQLYSFNSISSQYKENLVLNFGNNDISTITDIRFDNNPRIGESLVSKDYPTDSFNGESTKFYPSQQDANDNFWIEVYDSNNKTTGRAAKFTPEPVFSPYGEIVDFTINQETDTNSNPIYYTNDTSDLSRYFDIDSGDTYVGDFIPPVLKLRFFNEFLDTTPVDNVQRAVIKLYKPLNPLLVGFNCKVDRVVRDSRIERVIVYPTIVEEVVDDFSQPNFAIDLNGYAQSVGTDLKSWNDLLDSNLTTSQQIIDKYISSSFGNLNINIDYSDFSNYVHYSSAVERARNFKYKLELIESYNDRIATLESVSGSFSLTNISQSISRRDNVISGFDGFEKWLYYETTGSLYTHYSSSAYTIKPWPKQSKYPLTLYHTTSSISDNYYNGLIDSASIFDAFNDARLTKLIPSAIAEDTLNNDYVLFIDMIGHHFDITWSYIKKLTSIYEREEHPYDGMPNELLYDVAKSMGWQLANGRQSSDLWKYAVGTDKFGNPLQSGSLESKPDEQINYEVWRRIVNNLPYLLKTKGTARSVKALISTYGIPQTFLSIREYGGPVIDNDVRPIWEHERFVYNLVMSSPSYISVPWGKIDDINPDTYTFSSENSIDNIELQFKQNVSQKTTLLYKTGSNTDFLVLIEPTASLANRGNIHLYLSGSGGYKSASISDVPVFDSTMGSLFLQRDASTNDISQDNTYTIHYRRYRNGEISTKESASISVNGSTESSYNANWTGSGDIVFGNPNVVQSNAPSLWASSNYISGSIQEIRFWSSPLDDIVMDEHTLSREMYHGNSPTSSFFDLKFRFITDSQIRSVTNPDGILSQHPNQQITETSDNRVLSASLYNFNSNDLVGVVDEYYTKVPSAGANNIMNNKVRVESSTLSGILDVDVKKERSRFDSAPVDSNKLGIFLSATDMYNSDVYNHTGYFEIDDYIGDPDCRPGYNDTNDELDFLRRQVFRKYSSKNLINTVIGLLSRYDFTVFKQIKQLLPARVNYHSGILIEPHILERPKFKSRTNLSYTRPQYEFVLKQVDKPVFSEYILYETDIDMISDDFVTASKHDYTSNIDLSNSFVITAQRDDLASIGQRSVTPQYEPSTYQYTILNYSPSANVGFGLNWTTSSNGYWNYNPTGSNALQARPSDNASSLRYYYSSSLSASLGLYYSSSYISARVSTDNQPLSIQNLKFLGCKMTSDSITTNSPDTIDGRPVIEVFSADPNTLIVTSQNSNQGNLALDTNINVPYLQLNTLQVNSDLQFNQQIEYTNELNRINSEISRLSNVESSAENYFDILYNNELLRQQNEDNRQSEFDIINGE